MKLLIDYDGYRDTVTVPNNVPAITMGDYDLVPVIKEIMRTFNQSTDIVGQYCIWYEFSYANGEKQFVGFAGSGISKYFKEGLTCIKIYDDARHETLHVFDVLGVLL